MLRIALLASIGAISLAATPAAESVPITFATDLAPEVGGSSGTGSAVVVYDDATRMLNVSVQFSGVTGLTTVAHIHCCVDPPGTAGVATTPGTFPGFPMGVTSDTYAGTWSLADQASYTPTFLTASGGTVFFAEAALIGGIEAGRAYVNVHTTFAPGGEIRGFLAQVPEPGTLVLLLIGLLGLASTRPRYSRRRDSTP